MRKTTSPLFRPDVRDSKQSGVSVFLLLTSGLLATATAATLKWDATPGSAGIQDGSGVWSTSSNTWNDGSNNLTWNNLSVNDAVIGAGGAGGTITVSGSVSVGNVSFETVTSPYLVSSGTLTLAGTGGVSTVTANHAATINSTLAGGSKLVKAGNEMLTLGGANSYNGGTDLSAGTLRITSATALGSTTGAFNFLSSGTLQLNSGTGGAVELGSLSGGSGALISRGISGDIILRAGSNNQRTDYAGTIEDGSGRIIFSKRGSGVLTLSGNNTYTGATYISDGGILQVVSNKALGSSSEGVVINAGTLQLAGGIAVAGETIAVNTPGDVSLGSINNLSGSNSWTGAVNLNTSTRISSTDGLMELSGNVTGSGQSLTLAGSGDLMLRGAVVLGTGGLNKVGSGTATLLNPSYSGNTTLGVSGGGNAGTLNLQGSSALSTGAMIVYSGNLNLGQNHSVTSLALGGGATNTTARLDTGSNTLTLRGDVTYNAGDGSSTISSGASIAGNIAMGSGERIFDVRDSSAAAIDLQISASLSGNNLTKTGNGTLALNGANTYTGVTTIRNGALQIGSDAALGQAPGSPSIGKIVLNPGTKLGTTNSFSLNSNRGIQLNSSSASYSQGVIDVGPDATLHYGGIISGNGGILGKSGTGTLVLSGAHTYTGFTGTVTAANPEIGTSVHAGMLELDGGSITHGSSYIVVGNLPGHNGNFLMHHGAKANTLSGIVGDQVGATGQATISGAGTNWTTTGGMFVGNYGTGVLNLTEGGTLKVGSGALSLGLNNSPANGTLNIGAPASGTATSPGILSATNVYGGSGSATVQFNHNSTAAAPYHFSSSGDGAGTPINITGRAQLVHSAGHTVMNGTNTFTGSTLINGGVLALNGSFASGNTVSVNGGGTLLGSGRIAGATTIQGGGIHSPGGAPATVGSQQFTGNLTYVGASIFSWDLNASSTTSGFDTVVGTSGGTLTIDNSLASDPLFRIVLGSDALAGINDPGVAFWNSSQTWDDVFKGFGSVVGSFGDWEVVDASNNPVTSSRGSFSVSGTTITWSAGASVPEPTSALVGLLMGAGLLRRRRSH
ncbi:beta strand repeat-containing protein [Haloferula chungangensis]|uniref:Beta strand repeat-containing protein n=1 Tax=Haloferula chungangensis TaxID=1048331 RepID=A0ABW2LCB9_9BACT